MSNEPNKPIEEEELKEKELEDVTGGRRIVGGEGGRFEDRSPIFRRTILIR